jgi:uncharacterized protein (TIGR00251 family)
VQPRSSCDSLDAGAGERIRVRLTAPPVEGKANRRLVRFLARQFGVPQRQVQLLSGENSRDKRVRIISPRRLPTGIPGRGT